MEAAARVRQVAEHCIERAPGRRGEGLVSGELISREVSDRELCLIGEQFLEVGLPPGDIDRVAMEASAELIVDAPGLHRPQRFEGHPQGLPSRVRIGGGGMHVEEESQRAGFWKFRWSAEAAMPWIKLSGDCGECPVSEYRFGGRCRRLGNQGERPQRGGRLASCGEQLLPVGGPGVDNLPENRPEPWPARPVFRREIGPASQGLTVWRQPDAERPAAASRRRLDKRHVDLIDVRSLVAVHLDADKVLIEKGSRFGVLERLSGHHVAPMAGRESTREKDRLVVSSCKFESLGSPGPPVDGVMSVFEEIGRLLTAEPVRLWLCCGRNRSGGKVRENQRTAEKQSVHVRAWPQAGA